LLPGVGALDAEDFAFDGFEAVEEQLADVGEEGGVARGDTVLGDQGEEFTQDVVEVVGGLELAGEGGEFGGNAVGVAELLLSTGMVETEGGVGVRARHAAATAVGEAEKAAGRIFETGNDTAFTGYLLSVHEMLLRRVDTLERFHVETLKGNNKRKGL
jgi:hypothetical protein